MDRIEECKKCKRPFAVSASAGAPIQDYEDIECPHCGDMWGRDKAGGAYSSKPLTPEQESAYRSRKL